MVEMSRDFFERVHTENIVLDIGGDIGALMVYADAHLRGKEIEISPKSHPTHRTHTAILERHITNRVTFVGVFPALQAGDYYLWSNTPDPIGEVTIVGGAVAEVDGRGLIDTVSVGG
jgi:hypothetical protein